MAPATRPLRARESHPSSSDRKTQLIWLFSKSPKSSARASGAWRHFHPQVPIFNLGFLFWHLWMTHPPRTRVNTCAQVCTKLTHVLSRKVLSLTKSKGKIYKTKSLGHYITVRTRSKNLFDTAMVYAFIAYLCRLRLYDTPTVSLQSGRKPPTSVLLSTLNSLWNEEYPFIANTPRFSMSQSIRTW